MRLLLPAGAARSVGKPHYVLEKIVRIQFRSQIISIINLNYRTFDAHGGFSSATRPPLAFHKALVFVFCFLFPFFLFPFSLFLHRGSQLKNVKGRKQDKLKIEADTQFLSQKISPVRTLGNIIQPRLAPRVSKR